MLELYENASAIILAIKFFERALYFLFQPRYFTFLMYRWVILGGHSYILTNHREINKHLFVDSDHDEVWNELA
jgi:hypothetical protein